MQPFRTVAFTLRIYEINVGEIEKDCPMCLNKGNHGKTGTKHKGATLWKRL